MKKIFFVFFIFSLQSMALAQEVLPQNPEMHILLKTTSRDTCSCYANVFSKKYYAGGVDNFWWGGKRIWSCDYTCSNKSKTQIVTGNYNKTYYGDDDGLWGVCEGLSYNSFYNRELNREIYILDETQSNDDRRFHPKSSNAKELVQWGRQNCN